MFVHLYVYIYTYVCVYKCICNLSSSGEERELVRKKCLKKIINNFLILVEKTLNYICNKLSE